MAKHIGIVICDAEGGASCYRMICSGAADLMGEYNHPEISTHSLPLTRYLEAIETGDTEKVAELLLASARKLTDAGADFIICPNNTVHQVYDLVVESSPLPWIHIADPVRKMAVEMGLKKLAIMGSEYLMKGSVYPDYLKDSGIETVIPAKQDRVLIDKIVLSELVYGICTRESSRFIDSVIHSMKDLGCDGIVLGCAGIPLLGDPFDSPVPLLDSTRLLAEKAVREALRD